MANIGMLSLGCNKNRVDAEIMLAHLKSLGHTIINDTDDCDCIIINTCGFIEPAKQEAIDTILEFCQIKKEGRIKSVIVTGCLAERYQTLIREEIPEVDAVLGIGANDKIGEAIAKTLAGETFELFCDKHLLKISGERLLTTPSHYAYLKIAEGCSNCCTYCAIPSIRGRFRSRTIESIFEEADRLVRSGVKELILVAQDTTMYGEDIYGKSELPQLVNKLSKIDGLKWIRLLYCYPERISDELINAIADNHKVCKYLDIPIQHCDDVVLKNMNRRGSEDSLMELISKLRRKIPDISIRTTVICGFPGESDSQFEKLCEFIKKAKFEHLGCFPYSPEEDTKAAEFPGQLDQEIKNRRCEIIMNEQNFLLGIKNQLIVGKTFDVIVDEFDVEKNLFVGRTQGHSPEIDGCVFVQADSSAVKIGEIIQIKITSAGEYDMFGEVIGNSNFDVPT